LSIRRSAVLTVSLLCAAVLAGAAHAATKPKITVDPLGRVLRVSFVAPSTTTLHMRYFVRAETPRQEGCSWKSTSVAKGGRAGSVVVVNLSPNSFQGREWCQDTLRVTVFMQRAQGGLVAKDATAQTFRLVGTARFSVE
jgi:hypothetical protein